MKQRALIAALVVLGVVGNFAIAAPAFAMRELAAMHCCVDECGHTLAATAASRCCAIATSHSSDRGTSSQTTQLSPGQPLLLLIDANFATASHAGSRTIETAPPTRAAGPPLFLSQRSLLL